MADITFICKYNNQPEKYYGKVILDYLSDDHEGIDTEIYSYVEKLLNTYNTKNNLPEIQNLHIGILGVLKHNDDLWCTDLEKNAFDIYIDNIKNINYFNGEII